MAIEPIPGQGDIDETVWDNLQDRGDGVVLDTDGTGLEVTAPGTGTVTEVAPGFCRVGGFRVRNTATASLDHSAVGTPPTGGQVRYDDIVVVHDLAAPDLDTAGSIEILPGSPVATGSAEPAAPARESGTERRLWLARVPWVDGTAIPTGTPQRRAPWLGRELFLPSGAPLPASAPLGTLVMQPGEVDRMRGLRSGSPAWLERHLAPEVLASVNAGAFGEFRSLPPGSFITLTRVTLSDAPRGLLRVHSNCDLRVVENSAGSWYVTVNQGSPQSSRRWQGNSLDGPFNQVGSVVSPGGTVEIRVVMTSDAASQDTSVNVERPKMLVEHERMEWL